MSNSVSKTPVMDDYLQGESQPVPDETTQVATDEAEPSTSRLQTPSNTYLPSSQPTNYVLLSPSDTANQRPQRLTPDGQPTRTTSASSGLNNAAVGSRSDRPSDEAVSRQDSAVDGGAAQQSAETVGQRQLIDANDVLKALRAFVEETNKQRSM